MQAALHELDFRQWCILCNDNVLSPNMEVHSADGKLEYSKS